MIRNASLAIHRPMKVLNIHERQLPVPVARAGMLVDSLSSLNDSLWPRRIWPAMTFDRPLGVGAVGGHGPIRYVVESYAPGRSIRFRFTAPKGFDGCHGFELVAAGTRTCILRHTLEVTACGPAQLSWPLVFRPLHDALIEDALALAEASLGQTPTVRRWSMWVRLLRRIIAGGGARPQVVPDVRFEA